MKRAVCRVGLTGGIGSGKSTVAQMLARLGACVIDADAMARQVTLAGGAAIAAISAEFGSTYIGTDGALLRERMRETVFSNPSAKRRLENIIHPLVSQQIDHQTNEALATGAHCIVYDVPLLVESERWRQRVHRVLVVDCTHATQVERVMRRSQLTREAVEKIIASQADRHQRLKAADAVIHNNALSLPELQHEVAQIGSAFGL